MLAVSVCTLMRFAQLAGVVRAAQYAACPDIASGFPGGIKGSYQRHPSAWHHGHRDNHWPIPRGVSRETVVCQRQLLLHLLAPPFARRSTAPLRSTRPPPLKGVERWSRSVALHSAPPVRHPEISRWSGQPWPTFTKARGLRVVGSRRFSTWIRPCCSQASTVRLMDSLADRSETSSASTSAKALPTQALA